MAIRPSESVSGTAPRSLHIPMDIDERVRAVAASSYRYSVTAQMGVLPTPLPDPHRVPRLDTYYFRLLGRIGG